MNVIFVSSLDYNVGGAAQHRHQNYFKYINDGGSLLINLNNESFFDENFKVISFPRFVKIIPWKLKLILFLFPMLFVAFLKTKSEKVIFCYDRNFLILGACYFFSKIFRIKLIHEITEYPDVVLEKNINGFLTLNFFEKFLIKKIDGIAVISRSLYEYVSLKSSVEKIIIPSFVNLDQNTVSKLNSESINFTYIGSLSQEKDGVLDLVQAFHICQKNNAKIIMKLNIYGDGTKEQKKKIENLIKQFRLEGKVILHGFKSKSELDISLKDATVLVHCRPLSKQAKGGFSTKLTEYLSTGKPVIATITSDIGRYASDSKNIYLVPPNDIVSFAKKMSLVLNSLEVAQEVGMNGYYLADQYFNAESNIGKFKKWMKEDL